jgi:hypothetical protein
VSLSYKVQWVETGGVKSGDNPLKPGVEVLTVAAREDGSDRLF